jgi:hypothetical protein
MYRIFDFSLNNLQGTENITSIPINLNVQKNLLKHSPLQCIENLISIPHKLQCTEEFQVKCTEILISVAINFNVPKNVIQSK